MEKYKNLISGEHRTPNTGKYADNLNPGDLSDTIGQFAASDRTDVQTAIEAASGAFPDWANVPGPDRGKILFRFADLLSEYSEELARMLSREEGKVLGESRGEVGRAIAETRFMAGEASRLNGEHYSSNDPDIEVMRRRIPLGPVAVITPWNFPIVTPVRKISPAVAYGDTVVFKPAALTPATALRLVELFWEAGVPPGVLNCITGAGSEIGDALSGSPEIRGITFTGSTTIGKRIYANSVDNLTKVQLEMGGKNPAFVYDAEDLDYAASQIVAAAFASAGQRCTAISRVIVSEHENDALLSKLEQRVKQLRVGDALDESVDMGPLVSSGQLETVEKYVDLARKEGARILFGGERANGPSRGYYYLPTLISDVRRDSPVALEEIFGPVLSVQTVSSFEEGLEMCNEPRYGLAGCVFTRYLAKAKTFLQSMNSGMVHINHGTASQPHVPFGGVKESGFGAYSIGPTAREFYMSDKVVYLK
ncbi:MAG: aldehyde dehydrogenase family protein [Spirochaetota bacterium]